MMALLLLSLPGMMIPGGKESPSARRSQKTRPFRNERAFEKGQFMGRDKDRQRMGQLNGGK